MSLISSKNISGFSANPDHGEDIQNTLRVQQQNFSPHHKAFGEQAGIKKNILT
jgi:hypothetical protein